jgi:PAS domain S-box-containing protein
VVSGIWPDDAYFSKPFSPLKLLIGAADAGRMNGVRSTNVREPSEEDKALSAEQHLKYAEDLAELFSLEQARRKALEAANKKLRAEIAQRKRVEKELIQSEKRYRSLFEDSREAIYITTRQGRFIAINEAYLELLGYTRKEILKLNVSEIYADPTMGQVFQEEIEARGEVRDFELQLRKKDGSIVDCVTTATVVRIGDGSDVGYQGITRDVTGRKRAEEMLQHAKRMEALGRMVAGIAHEIRNPLAIASSAAQFLIDGDLAPDLQTNCMQKIVSGVNRASVIIENLLTFARLTGEVIMTEVNLNSLLRGTIRLMTDEARKQNVRVIYKAQEDFLIVKGHAGLLQQVFTNMFTNALTAMQGGGILTITVAKNERDALVMVADTGCGIPEDDIEKIFEPFFSGSPGGLGRGLGLSVSYSIMKQHLGDIQVSSLPGKGTTFAVSLPLMRPKENSSK